MDQENINQTNIEVENKPTKKAWFKRKKKLVITLSIILVIILLIVGGALASKKAPEYSTTIIQRGELKQTVDATGKIESAENINLNFKSSGRISRVYVQTGEKVTAGKILATLEAGALQSQVTNAQANLKQAQADYDKLLAGASSADINVSENTVKQREQELMTAKNNLSNLELTRDTELNNLRETAITTLKNELVSAKNAMFVVDETLTNDDARDTLSVKNISVLNSAQQKELDTNSLLSLDETTIMALDSATSDNQILQTLDNFKSSLNSVADTLSTVLDVLNNTTVSTDLTETELETLKTNIKTQQSANNTSKNSIQTAKSNWTYKVAYYNDQVMAYADAIKSAQTALETAGAQLMLKKSPPRQFEIDYAHARIESAQANLNLAYANLNDTIIIAPVDGVITKRNLEPGEYASLSAPVLEMIGESNLQIEVDIPESDIAKINLGQNVEITLDAFTSDDVFEGSVVFIDPAETIISDVVYYKVKVQFSELENLKDQIKPGMTANVTICTNKKEDVLAVPARAVKSNDGDKYVEIVSSRKGKKVEIEKIKVTTGLRGDEGIEIISGLDEGMEVVTFVKE